MKIYEQKILDFVNSCIQEGEAVLATKWVERERGHTVMLVPEVWVDIEKFTRWRSNCLVLLNMLGSKKTPWVSGIPENSASKHSIALKIMGSLRSIQDTISKGFLSEVADFVYAEAFANLFEQAEYLQGQGYDLAAGVICRAVLEEKLRNLVSANSLTIAKARPTISDYNAELYKAQIYDKIVNKNVDFMTAIGNKAAHNQGVTKEEVSQLIQSLRDFLNKYS